MAYQIKYYFYNNDGSAKKPNTDSTKINKLLKKAKKMEISNNEMVKVLVSKLEHFFKSKLEAHIFFIPKLYDFTYFITYPATFPIIFLKFTYFCGVC